MTKTLTMKAVVLKDFGSVDNFELAEVPKPVAKDNEVLVRIRATAFNPIDYQMRRGDSESKLLRSAILGREFSGIVESAGMAVRDFKPGDHVAAYAPSLASNGTYAEYISLPQQVLAKKSASLSFEQAAALPLAGLTALQCAERLQLSPDQRVFVTGGAGGVGTILLQLLKTAGIHHVITMSGNEHSRAHLRALGLNDQQVIDYRQGNLTELVKAAVSGEEYDCCIDLVGGTASELCAAVIKLQGTYVDVTHLATESARSMLFDKATLIMNVANYAYAIHGKPDQLVVYGDKLRSLFHRIETNLLLPAPVQILGGLSGESVKSAHQLLESNGTKGKKLVMSVGK